MKQLIVQHPYIASMVVGTVIGLIGVGLITLSTPHHTPEWDILRVTFASAVLGCWIGRRLKWDD